MKQNELRRIRTEVLPEVAALMAERDFEKAIEWLEDAVAFASGYDERELLDSMSCLLARCFLSLGKPKEALGGLNPALMHARRTGGPTAVKPHSVAAECFIAMGDREKVRVELRALMEAAAESEDEREQCGALLFAGCVLFDLGDLSQAVAVLASATTAAEKTKDHGARATASHPRAPRCSVFVNPRRRSTRGRKSSERSRTGRRRRRRRRPRRSRPRRIRWR